MHMDGARLMNAVIAGGYTAAEAASHVDSVWVDLSKGLGAPVGAVLCGTTQFIEEARLLKHRLGGAMRQAGVIAAAGIYAFEHNVERLAEDHANAKLLEAGIAEIPGLEPVFGPVETNIVFFDVSKSAKSAAAICSSMECAGVRMSQYPDPTKDSRGYAPRLSPAPTVSGRSRRCARLSPDFRPRPSTTRRGCGSRRRHRCSR